MRRVPSVTLFVAALVAPFCTSATEATPDLASRTPAATEPNGTTQLPAHVACIRGLETILKAEPVAGDAIRQDNLALLTRLHEDIDDRLRAARIDMDRAFLTGAWQSPAMRPRAAELLGQMEAVQMLNFIGLAFLKGYDNPTHKVSLSVRDANEKMFMQLGQLLAALNEFNSTTQAPKGASDH